MSTPPKDTQSELKKKKAAKAAAALARAQAKGGKDANPIGNKRKRGGANSDTDSIASSTGSQDSLAEEADDEGFGPSQRPRSRVGRTDAAHNDDEDDGFLGFGAYNSDDESEAGDENSTRNKPKPQKGSKSRRDLARRLRGTEEEFDKVSQSGNTLSEADTDREDRVPKSDDDTDSVSSETPDTTQKTRAGGIKSLLFDMAGRLSDVASNLLGKKTTDEEWSNIRENIVEAATKSGFTTKLNNKKNTITLLNDGKKCIFITREKDTSLTFSAKKGTTARQLAEMFAASGSMECTISKAESAKMAAELYFELTAMGIAVKIPENILDRMRKKAEQTPPDDGSLACQKALAAYSGNKPNQKPDAEEQTSPPPRRRF